MRREDKLYEQGRRAAGTYGVRDLAGAAPGSATAASTVPPPPTYPSQVFLAWAATRAGCLNLVNGQQLSRTTAMTSGRVYDRGDALWVRLGPRRDNSQNRWHHQYPAICGHRTE